MRQTGAPTRVVAGRGKAPIRVVMIGESLSRQGGVVAVERLILEQRIPTVHTQHIASLPNAGLVTKLVVFARAALTLVWLLLRSQVDLVHLHVSQKGSAFRKSILASIAVAFGKPVIMHAHGGTFPAFYSHLPRAVRAWMRLAFRRCSRVLVLSHGWKQFYVRQLGVHPDHVVVLPNPVALPAIVPDRKSAGRVQILYLGKLNRLKGSFDLIEAFARLPKEQRSQARLVLAGNGEVSETRALVHRRNLSGSVALLEWVDTLQRDRLLKESLIFVLPSYYEGLPMALLEAMAWTLPVITTPVGGIPEVVTHGYSGLLVGPGEIDRLADAMRLLIHDEDLRLRLGRNARIRVEQFDIGAYSRSLAAIYRSAAAPVDSPPVGQRQRSQL